MVVREDSDAARHPRADAARNRQRLLSAAAEVFREHGLEAPVGEIAARAGLGRATLFRNFPTKQALMAALLAQEMRRSLARGRELLAGTDGTPVMIQYARQFVELQQSNRGLLESVAADAFMQDPEIAEIRDQLMDLVDAMIAHDRQLGLVREGIDAHDILLLMKGVCAVACSPLGTDPGTLERHLELIAVAIAAPPMA